MGLLERGLLGAPFRRIPVLIPGFAAACLLAWVSFLLRDLVGTVLLGFEKSPVSPVMTALLLGIIIRNVVPLPAFVEPGLSLAVKKILRLGIILLGMNLSIVEVFRLGVLGVPIVLLCLAGSLAVTVFISRRMRLPERLGTLIAVGTSICGVLAIVATGPSIGAKEEEVTYAVAVITVFGLIATVAYPHVAEIIFAGDPTAVGLFLGTAVHDTSQVTGAALVYCDVYLQPKALVVATVTKLVRNVSMVGVIPLMAFVYQRRERTEGAAGTGPAGKIRLRKLLPVFVLGFLMLATLRSIGDLGIRADTRAFGLWTEAAWISFNSTLKNWAVRLLVVALAGVGLNTRFSTIRGLGFKPFVAGLAAALVAGVISFAAITLLGGLVRI